MELSGSGFQLQKGVYPDGDLYADKYIHVPQDPGGENPKAGMEETPQQERHFWVGVLEDCMKEPVEESILIIWVGSVLLPVNLTSTTARVTKNLD